MNTVVMQLPYKTVIEMSVLESPVEIYDCKVWVVFGPIVKTLEAYFKDEEGNVAGLTRDLLEDLGVILVTFEHPPGISTAVHELYHTMDFICKNRGIEPSGNNEAQAYLLDYLVDNFYKRYNVEDPQQSLP